MDDFELSTKLYELRKSAGLSQDDFAEKMQVSRQAVSKWERGETYPDTYNLMRIAKFYGVSIDELIENDKHDVSRKSEDENVALFGSDRKCDEEKTCDNKTSIKKPLWQVLLMALPYPIIITILYLCWGILFDGFAKGWTLFLTIPLYYSIISSIKNKSFCEFAYPVLVAFIYLFVGMIWGIWHPTWIIFITIPVYYALAEVIDKNNKK